MKILHISYADDGGGGARAAYRLHRALLDAGMESRMRVRHKISGDWTVRGPDSPFAKAATAVRTMIWANIPRLRLAGDERFGSMNLLPSNWAPGINHSDIDLVHLHWVNAETMSIEDIGRITKPAVMSLHDMWGFCGTEHYASDEPAARWRKGYDTITENKRRNGIDLDRWTWRRKRKAWRRRFRVLCPSRWLTNCAEQSALMSDWNVATIPNILDTKTFQPLDRAFSRSCLNLPPERPIILFGAVGGGRDPRKGYDLLLDALGHLHRHSCADEALCVIFGQSEPRDPPTLPIPIRWLGVLRDEVTLALLYSAGDVMIVPSRLENLVQTGTEAQSCGCPVVAFDVGGMPDVVAHGTTGYLAARYDTSDLARGVAWVLESKPRRKSLGQAARRRAIGSWSREALVSRYLEAYGAAIALGRRDGSSADEDVV